MTDILLELQANSRDLICLMCIGYSLLTHEQIEAIVSADDQKTSYVNAACVSAIVSVMTRWLKTGMAEPAEEISLLCCELLKLMRETA